MNAFVCTATVVWRGGDDELWLATNNLNLRTWSAPRHYQVGSPPHGVHREDRQCAEHRHGHVLHRLSVHRLAGRRQLPIARADQGKSPSMLNVGFGPLGSAPTVAWSTAKPTGQLFVYWNGFDGYLVEAHDDLSGWHRTVLTQLGKI